MSPSAVISEPIEEVVSTGADIETPISREEPVGDWQGKVYSKLEEWATDPNTIEDVGVDAPSVKIITTAMRVANWLRKAGWDCPDSVVPDANGGIVFRYRNGGSSQVFYVWDDGSIERHVFVGTRLVERVALELI